MEEQSGLQVPELAAYLTTSSPDNVTFTPDSTPFETMTKAEENTHTHKCLHGVLRTREPRRSGIRLCMVDLLPFHSAIRVYT